MASFPLREHTILVAVSGSRAYGLSGPDSDVDLKGICVPPLPVLLGPFGGFEQIDDPGGLDVFGPDLTAEEQRAARRTKLEGTVYDLRTNWGTEAG